LSNARAVWLEAEGGRVRDLFVQPVSYEPAAATNLRHGLFHHEKGTVRPTSMRCARGSS